jgi:hypothetical protein
MFRDSAADPRSRPLPPTTDEVEAWARREQERRQAWLAGPSDEEKQEWARRYRRRARFGLEESRLGPSRAEVEDWAERERSRRLAWAAGPTDSEAPTAEGASAWAEREKLRRREWLSGPSEDEKRDWAQRQGGGAWADWMSPEAIEERFPEIANRVLREAELAGKGSLYALSRAPAAIWSYFVRAGRSFEHEFYQQPRRRRVPF